MDFDARTDTWNWVLPVKKLCECGHSLMSFGALFSPAVYTVQKSVCTNFLPGVVEEAFAFFSHGPPIAPFSALLFQSKVLYIAVAPSLVGNACWICIVAMHIGFPDYAPPESANSQVLLQNSNQAGPRSPSWYVYQTVTLFSTVHKNFAEDCDSLLNRVPPLKE